MSKSLIEELFEKNYNSYKRYLASRFNHLNDFDIEDIIAQTVLKLLSKGDDLLAIRSLSSYTYKALRNGAVDLFKKHGRETVWDDTYDEESVAAEDEVLHDELKANIKHAICSLDEKYRYVLVETEMKGRSYKELSEESGLPLGTLLSQKSRASKKMQKLLNEYLKGGTQND